MPLKGVLDYTKGNHLACGVRGASGWTAPVSSHGGSESPHLRLLGEQKTVHVASALQKYLRCCSRWNLMSFRASAGCLWGQEKAFVTLQDRWPAMS